MHVLHCPSHSRHCPVIHNIGEPGVPHVEQPRRAECVIDTLRGLEGVKIRAQEREASDDELKVVHDEKLIRFLSEAHRSLKEDGSNLDEVVPEVVGKFFSSLFFPPSSCQFQFVGLFFPIS